MATNAELGLLIEEKRRGDQVLREVATQLGSFQRAMESTVGSAERFNRSMGEVSRGLNGFLATGAKIGGITTGVASGIRLVGDALDATRDHITSVVKASSDLSESQNKVEVVFGASAAAIKQFAESSDTSLGLSKQAALEAAGTFGNLFTAMGFGQRTSADMSRNLLTLAADLASFNNISVDDALLKLRSGLVGEVEPLRTLGVNLNQADIELEAVRLGLVAQGQELTAAGKAAAAYSLIFQQTTTAQGDFARTADGLANSTRILQAGFTDLQAAAGEALLPLATSGVQSINEFIRLTKSAQAEGLTPLDAALKATAASIRTNLGDDAAEGFQEFTRVAGDFLGTVGRIKDGAPQALSGLGEVIRRVFDGDLQGVLDDTIQPKLGEWRKAFSTWAGPAWDGLKGDLNQLADHLGGFIKDNGPFLTERVTNEWTPAFVDWVLNQAWPQIRDDLTEFVSRVSNWAANDGARMMREAGLNLRKGYLEALTGQDTLGPTMMNPAQGDESLVGQLFRNTGTAVNTGLQRVQDDLSRPATNFGLGPSTNLRGLGGGEPPRTETSGAAPLVNSGGVLLTAEQIAQNVAEFRENWEAYQRSLQEVADTTGEVAGAIAGATPSAGGTGATGGSGDANPLFGRDKPDDRVRRAQQETTTAIQGFMSGLAQDLPRWEQIFGAEGAKIRANLETALTTNTGSAGEALARSVQDLAKTAERAGVPEFQRLADELAGSLHDSLLNRGNVAMKAAALENLRAYTEAIKAANALTSESFARAFDLAQLATSLGSQGASVMESLNRAFKEGGADNLKAAAQAAESWRVALLNNRDLSPERAQELWTEIFGEIKSAIAAGGQDAYDQLRDVFARFNQAVGEEGFTNIRDKAVESARTAFEETRDRIEADAAKQIAEMQQSIRDSRALREASENVRRQQGGELKNFNLNLDVERQAERDRQEDERRTRDRAREDADVARRRAQEDADLQKKLHDHSGVTGQLGLGGALGDALRQAQTALGQVTGRSPLDDAQRQIREQAKALEESRRREDEERSRRRALEDADLAAGREQREKDAAIERERIQRLEAFQEEQAKNLQTFLDAQADNGLEIQKGRVVILRDEQIKAAREAFEKARELADSGFTEDLARLRLLHDAQNDLLSPQAAQDILDSVRRGEQNARDVLNLGPFTLPNPAAGLGDQVPTLPSTKTTPANDTGAPTTSRTVTEISVTVTINVPAFVGIPGGAEELGRLVAPTVVREIRDAIARDGSVIGAG